MKVDQQLSACDRLGSHLLDELGIETGALSSPLQAAWISAAILVPILIGLRAQSSAADHFARAQVRCAPDQTRPFWQ